MGRLGQICFDTEFVRVGHDLVQRPTRFRWDGPPVANVSVRMAEDFAARGRPLRAGDQFQIGPFLVEVIECHLEGYFTVRRLDHQWVQSWLLGQWYRIRQYGRMVRGRVILTLAIWDLAEWPYGEEPGWKHVRLKWVRQTRI